MVVVSKRASAYVCAQFISSVYMAAAAALLCFIHAHCYIFLVTITRAGTTAATKILIDFIHWFDMVVVLMLMVNEEKENCRETKSIYRERNTEKLNENERGIFQRRG